MPCVRHVIATSTKTEAGNLARFDSPDALAPYFGVIPRTWQSGEEKVTLEGRSSRGTYI